MTKIALALNVADSGKAYAWLERLGSSVDCYKLQMDLFGRSGPELVRRFVASGVEVFLDLKFHDIPSVVASAVSAAAEMGVALLTVHTAGGHKMLAAAAEASRRAGANRPRVLGVTVLTSLDEAGLEQVTGCRQAVADRVRALARLARDAGCDGIVCSPQEVKMAKQELGAGFLAVCPGIRLAPEATSPKSQASDSNPEAQTQNPKPSDDQARTATPAEAARDGADYIVVGRPIYAAPDPLAAVTEIRRQLEGR